MFKQKDEQVTIKPSGRHQNSVYDDKGNVLYIGHGAMGRGRRACQEWCMDNGYDNVVIKKI